ncbi:GIY-YIG nuclease family protein [Parenemella sanctibonifatiensis]|uniref:GIY-YIG domain-containing protein n=1 Tax=Parenemella sanctibonifatiensis TaxID=2016505 RepID=A0A255EA60_9ACTN|nr:GIY-YIG nuclease family protein [Parenemella sanctibonifatiensis]OYN88464.1 hypothetical protein CGZ92_04295 [Parenemella sanctibonifatiensis]
MSVDGARSNEANNESAAPVAAPAPTLTFSSILHAVGIDPSDIMAIRHVYLANHEDGLTGILPDSTDEEILAYTARQHIDPRNFPATPPQLWAVFIGEGGDRARLWSVLHNRGEIASEGLLRTFDLVPSGQLSDLTGRLVIGWRAPRSWKLRGATVAQYPVREIADAQPVPFPGFGSLILDRPALVAAMREHRYATWRTALASVRGIYLITDTSDGRQYVGKADGAESILQRWTAYAANGHGGNVLLKGLDASHFRYSILRVFDPTTPAEIINAAESHYKAALDTRTHGLNAN